MTYGREVYPNELWHYGILGQKWGIRRYQNKDRSLTAAGQKRYGRETYRQVIKARNSGTGMDQYSKREQRILQTKNLKQAMEENRDKLIENHTLAEKAKKERREFLREFTDDESTAERLATEIMNEDMKRFGNGTIKGLQKWFYGYNDPTETPEEFASYYREMTIMEDDGRLLNRWLKEKPGREKEYQRLEEAAISYQKAENEYATKIADTILGEYGDRIVEDVAGGRYSVSARSAVVTALTSDSAMVELKAYPYNTTSGYDKNGRPVAYRNVL